MSALPSGTVTFLFTDVEGSTRLFQQHPEAMKAALARHHALLQRRDRRARRPRVPRASATAFARRSRTPAKRSPAALAGAARAASDEPWGGVGAAARAHGPAYRQRGGARRRLLSLADARAHAARRRGRTRRADAALVGRRGRGPRVRCRPEPRCATSARTSCAASPSRRRIYQFVAPDLPSEFPPLRSRTALRRPSAPLHAIGARRSSSAAPRERSTCGSSGTVAQQARGQLVLLSGEPGVGKTPPGAGPGRARAAERRDRPARRLLRVRGDDALPAVRGGVPRMDALAKCRAACGTRSARPRPRSPSSRRRSRRSSARSRQRDAVARRRAPAPLRQCRTVPRSRWPPGRGLLLFIDDMHWADQGTLSLLHYLLRHLRNDRVLVLAAYREVELDRTHPLAAALVDWNRERLATRVALGRLSRADTGALLAALFGMRPRLRRVRRRAVPRDRGQSVLHRGGRSSR